MDKKLPDRLMRDIRKYAVQNNVDSVILFGSRARGTHYDRSDVDLAVKGGAFEAFAEDIHDKAFSLLAFDIVKYDDDMSHELRNEINRDGVVIYEKI